MKNAIKKQTSEEVCFYHAIYFAMLAIEYFAEYSAYFSL